MKRIPLHAALAAALLASASLYAADGFVTGDVSLRAGPDPEFPKVAELPAGAPVSIMGCVADWSWCDVATRGERGWVAGEFLQEEYQGRRVVVREYGVRIGLPIVSFEFASYWDSHYRSRPWYAERTRYERVTPRFSASVTTRSSGTTMKSTEATASGSAATKATDTPATATATQRTTTSATSARTESARRATAQADSTSAVEQQSTPNRAVKSDTTTSVEKQATTQRGEDQKSAIEPSADRNRPAQARAKPNESRPDQPRDEDKGKPQREKPAKKDKSKDENDNGPDSE